MVRRLDMLFLATIALAALLQNSAAQNTHTVGESSGWTVPSATNFYSTWAANQTFRVGDTLVFTFASGSHNVAGVTKANFDACNTATTQFLNTTGPANVVLNSTGEKYYICTFPGHCSAGQKLAINVSAATTPSPAPQPSSPAPPTATPSPSPRATPSPAPASTPTPAPASTPTPPPSSPRPSAPVSPPTASPPPPPAPIAPTSPPSSTTPSPPASPPSSATSLGVAGLFATLLSLVVAVFLC